MKKMNSEKIADKMITEENIIGNKQLREYFKEKKEIKLVYLFGSMANKKEGKLSDIDIGILIDNSLDKTEEFELQLEIIGKLIDILKAGDIDLVIMNNASISLNYEVIKASKPIFIRDIEEKVDFEHYILSLYLDRRYYEKRATDEYLKKLAKEGV